RGAPWVFLVPVGRPLERPGAHPLKAQVALPAVLQELLSPRIEPAAGGIEARRPLPLHLARQALPAPPRIARRVPPVDVDHGVGPLLRFPVRGRVLLVRRLLLEA